LDLSAIPDDALKLYELARSEVSIARNAKGELILSDSVAEQRIVLKPEP
jgi:hypothetical protein